jgi:hypothetical protein
MTQDIQDLKGAVIHGLAAPPIEDFESGDGRL